MCFEARWAVSDVTEWPLQIYLLQQWQPGMNPIRAIRASADLTCLVVTWVLLTVPDWVGKKGERIFVLQFLSYVIAVLEEGSDTSHYETRDVILVHCWAAIKCRNPFESANFASDKSGISIGFSRTAAFYFFLFFKTSIKERKVRLVKHTLAATKKELVNLLTSQS